MAVDPLSMKKWGRETSSHDAFQVGIRQVSSSRDVLVGGQEENKEPRTPHPMTSPLLILLMILGTAS